MAKSHPIKMVQYFIGKESCVLGVSGEQPWIPRSAFPWAFYTEMFKSLLICILGRATARLGSDASGDKWVFPLRGRGVSAARRVSRSVESCHLEVAVFMNGS